MKNFEVHLILGEEEKTFEKGTSAQAIWNDLSTGVDFITFDLIDTDTKRVIMSGDTAHDNILMQIEIFISGMEYISKEDINVTYWVKYLNGEKIQIEKGEY